MQKAVGTIFFSSWLLCGCAVDSMFDDWRAALAVVSAVIVCAVTAAIMGGGE